MGGWIDGWMNRQLQLPKYLSLSPSNLVSWRNTVSDCSSVALVVCHCDKIPENEVGVTYFVSQLPSTVYHSGEDAAART